jgi:hypothetical protein
MRRAKSYDGPVTRTLLSILLLVCAGPARAKDRGLTGLWTLNGAPYAEFKSDGTCWVGQAKGKWKADGKTLVLSYDNGAREVMNFSLSGSSLTVTMNGHSRTLARGQGQPASGRGIPKDQLTALLMSSPWCYFSYNQISGASHQERIVFGAGGLWSSGKRGETYSRGAGGTVAGQKDSRGGGRWLVSGGKLLMSEGEAPMQDTGLTVSRNSNGYPVLHSGKKEYSQCR